MGYRHSVAANIVLNDKAPQDLKDQLNRLCNTVKGEELYELLDSSTKIPPGFNPNIAGLFRTHRNYGAVWAERSIVVPDKHYRCLGTTKYGDQYVRDACIDLETYLDLKQSWFLAIGERGEVLSIRWTNSDVIQAKQVRSCRLYERRKGNELPSGPMDLEEFDGDDIPAGFAERLATTTDPIQLLQLLNDIEKEVCAPGVSLVTLTNN